MRDVPHSRGLDFLAATSYKNATVSSGVVKIDYDIRSNIAGRHIILVEDILDSGNTLYNLAGHLRDRGAASVALCVLLDKPARREKPIQPNYVGFTVPGMSLWWGMAWIMPDRYRNLPYVGVLKPEVYAWSASVCGAKPSKRTAVRGAARKKGEKDARAEQQHRAGTFRRRWAGTEAAE